MVNQILTKGACFIMASAKSVEEMYLTNQDHWFEHGVKHWVDENGRICRQCGERVKRIFAKYGRKSVLRSMKRKQQQ